MNSTRPREYDGSHITFGGMNPAITLREHQKSAIAHVLYGGNTLFSFFTIYNQKPIMKRCCFFYGKCWILCIKICYILSR